MHADTDIATLARQHEELRSAVVDLLAHLTLKHVVCELADFSDWLERHYRPDQPRAPRGTPIGGQWIVDPTSARQWALVQHRIREAGIAEDLEELGGGKPIMRPSQAGAVQFIFPNGMILRFDIRPGQYRPSRGPHINLEFGGKNYHFYLR